MFRKKRKSKNKILGFAARLLRVMRWGFRILLLLLILDFFYLAVTWPDWKKLAAGPAPKSAFIHEYERRQAEDKNLPRLNWQSVPFASIPKHVIRAVILAEDARFYEHSGFDLIAFREAMDYNLAEGRFALGGSTISQQTAKNMFLSSAKNPLRKWHELILTWGMEQHFSKRRILEIYLNVAEFGPGVYGAQAAAQKYWGINISDVSAAQAAELAATLPGPVKNNPATRTAYFEKRAQKILALLERFPGDAVDAVYPSHPELFSPPPENGDAPRTDLPVVEPLPERARPF